jgi:hypothetical protein
MQLREWSTGLSMAGLTRCTGLQALGYALWDSDLERLVPFRFAAAG